MREKEHKTKRKRLAIILAVVIAGTAISINFARSGGGEQASAVQSNVPDKLIEATWIEPQLAGYIVSIPVSQVEDNWNTHFKLRADINGKSSDINFMAYILDEEIHVRSNLCPPCRSVGFSLENDILICDTCRTTFNAKTGEGIRGACVDYPKASVSYEIADGQLVMNEADLKAAYQDTLVPGWP